MSVLFARYLIMMWGCRKFSKKLINPDHVPSSELLNFLSRVPDEVTVRKCKQLSIKDPVLVAKEDERRASRDECQPWKYHYFRCPDADNGVYFKSQNNAIIIPRFLM